MSQMTDDSGTAAMAVDQELLDLRAACHRMDIKFHWKHKASSLQRMIKEHEGTAHPRFTAEEAAASANDTWPEVHATDSGNTIIVEAEHSKRTIPADVEAALQYMAAYKKANERLVRSFIESLL